MMKLNEKSLLSLFLLIFTIVMLGSSLGMRNDVVLMPRIIGTVLLVFTLIQFIVDVRSAKKENVKKTEVRESELPNNEKSPDKVGKENMSGIYIFIAWMTFFVALVYFIKMIAAIVVALLIYLRWQKESWKLSLGYSVGFGIISYLVFVVGMKIHYLM
jgi:hypothetical protein